MTDLTSEIAEYCKNVERKPVKRLELIQNLMRDAQVTRAWPIATLRQWEAALESACKRGLLVRTSETIWIPVVAVEAKPVQGSLF